MKIGFIGAGAIGLALAGQLATAGALQQFPGGTLPALELMRL